MLGSAEFIIPDSRHSKVIVKILKDDATANEKALFLEEVAPFRYVCVKDLLLFMIEVIDKTSVLLI